MFKKPYEYSVGEVRDDEHVTQETALILEGYAMALSDMMSRLSGDSPCGKSYDPMMIESSELAHSYAFDMKDGGRHHALNLYENLGEIMEVLLQEAVDWVEGGSCVK